MNQADRLTEIFHRTDENGEYLYTDLQMADVYGMMLLSSWESFVDHPPSDLEVSILEGFLERTKAELAHSEQSARRIAAYFDEHPLPASLISELRSLGAEGEFDSRNDRESAALIGGQAMYVPVQSTMDGDTTSVSKLTTAAIRS